MIDKLKLDKVKDALKLPDGKLDPAAEEWKTFWERSGIPLFSFSPNPKISPESYGDLLWIAANKIPYNAILSKPSAYRSVERLFDCINLDRMIEERSLGDYRAELENKFGKVHADAKSQLATAEEFKTSVDSIVHNAAHSNEHAILLENLRALSQLAGLSKKRLELLEKEFKSSSNSVAFARAFENTWDSVSISFGTWIRRLNPLRKWIGWGMVTALFAYLILGAVFPSQMTLWVLISVVIGVAAWRYWSERQRQESSIKKHLKAFNALNPTTGTFWTDTDPKLSLIGMSSAARESSEEAEVQDTRRLAFPLAVASAVIYVALLGAALSGFYSPPSYAAFVVNPTSNSACRVAGGTVMWAGPGRIVLLDNARDEGRVQLISSHLIAGLRSGLQLPECNAGSDNLAGPSTGIVSMIHADARILPRSLIIPFMDDVRGGCNDTKIYGEGTMLSDTSTKQVISQLKKSLENCRIKHGDRFRPPVIDIRGFASLKEFSCASARDQGKLNLALAEMRRTRVLEALASLSSPSSDGNWHPENFVLQPSGVRRWDSHADMRRFTMFDDSIDPVARYVELRLVDGGSCIADL
ncbi:hypothetical protein H4W19_14725 [Pseudoxanthomonas mexicana]|uniref:OmpA family protein n=1 Tax=Pseudoxanthomonas mexicana TaxID=128785 RepID=A0ABX6R8I4_PSEMX|nr:hypothetical protein [Pseudoxanthomonas mexicana]QND79585.1 hypothetical protein H4W19_14725 [Pseudoxanthomonas mexicana]WBX93144.1 hypothetical protein PE064_15880 [Pseudoxanthomonas mexicana]